jgi:hypothetical protein
MRTDSIGMSFICFSCQCRCRIDWNIKTGLWNRGLAFHLGITAARDGMRMQDGNLTDLNKIKVQAVQNGFSPSLTVGRKIATNVGINARVGYQNQMSNMLTDSNGPLSMNQWTMGARLWFSF